MRTLRIPTTREEITPEMMGELIANLRKLSNISGTGCTVHELPNGISINVPAAPQPRRGRLLKALYGCGSATAVEIDIDPAGNEREGEEFTVFDPLNKVAASPLAVADGNGVMLIEAGTCFDCQWKDDAQQWEVCEFGQCCAGGSNVPSGSASGGSAGSACITPAMLGLPSPPDNGKYALGVDNFCFVYLPIGQCQTGSGS